MDPSKFESEKNNSFRSVATLKGKYSIEIEGGVNVRPLYGVYRELTFSELGIDDRTLLTDGSITIDWTLHINKNKSGVDIKIYVNDINGILNFEGVDLDDPFNKEKDCILYDVNFKLKDDRGNFKFSVFVNTEETKVDEIYPSHIEIDFNINQIVITF